MEVLTDPDIRLHLKAEKIVQITPEIRKLGFRMLKTVKKLDALGLAANQIGVMQRIMVVIDEIMVNPKIIEAENWTFSKEACLSLPNEQYFVSRDEIVKVNYIDIQGKSHTKTLKGMKSIVFQHELDHLNGILISTIGVKSG